MRVVYDSETYPNCYLLNAVEGSGITRSFEISTFRNDLPELLEWINYLTVRGFKMVGFNNLGFDYPVLHFIVYGGVSDPALIYYYAMAVIKSENKFEHMIRPSDCYVSQVDLFKIHHFDNKARATSLKSLEFNMRLSNISDLPFVVGTVLTRDQIKVLSDYCWDDVNATVSFYEASSDKIAFREQLSSKYGRSFINFSDVRIGREIFQQGLEAAGVHCYEYSKEGRKPKQTERQQIRLADCVPPYIKFESPGFKRVLDFYQNKVITQTKGAFKELSAVVNGTDSIFGTGGIHASVKNKAFIANEDWMIYDIDVKGMYPSIAIANGYYPEHLGPKFIGVYRNIQHQRDQFKKGTVENAAYKLAGNGAYGSSNDKFSFFYDPLFTMKVTITGQLIIAMLVERLSIYEQLKIIQVNTDGITLWLPRSLLLLVKRICVDWEKFTLLTLESNEYSRMFVGDVNNYIAQKTTGEVKRVGRYDYEMDWHQDASALVVPKIAEKVLIEGAPIHDTLRNWPEKMDFMLRAKVNRGSQLVLSAANGEDIPLDRTQRYFVSTVGMPMTKIMPPLEKNPGVWRRFDIQSGYLVCPCNKMDNAVFPINYLWYEREIDKLVKGMTPC